MKRYFSLLILLVSYLHGAPTITKLSSAVGPTSGGTIVTITGTEFTGATAVHFGTTPALTFIVGSDTSITATTAAHAPQVVPVTVTTPSGTFTTTAHSQLFTYQGNILGYVTEDTGNAVTVIDTATNTIIPPPILVGDSPGINATTPDGTKVYVSNYDEGTVSVIDTATNTVVDTIIVGGNPGSIGITPDGTKLFVVNSNFSGNTVSVIDTAMDVLIQTITVGTQPFCVCITPDGEKAYITNVNSGTVSVIDIATLSVITTITVGANPVPACIIPNASKVLVGNFGGSTVSIIDSNADVVVATIPAGSLPVSVAITPDGTEAYVVGLFNTVTIIDLAMETVISTIPLANLPIGAVITPDGTKAYVDDRTSRTVSVINTTTHAIFATVPVQPVVGPLFVTSDGAKVFEISTSAISVIDTDTNTGSDIGIGPTYVFMAIAPDQAPLANFTTEAESLSITFDASSSASPTGDITLYSWNFGDGTYLDTSNPVTTHVYTALGIYTVTLTVTNSRGTSTDQIFNFNSMPYFLLSSLRANQSITVLQNGGPTATLSLAISVISSPPQNFQGRQLTNNFLTYTELLNRLTWDPPQSGAAEITSYKIYRNAALTDFVAEIPATGPFIYEDHNREPNTIYTYYIVTVSNGGTSQPASVTVYPIPIKSGTSGLHCH